MRALLANMGFVLQISGLFVLIPIIASFLYNETGATIGLFITATCFLVLGFLLNSLCEKKTLTFKQSSTLIVLVFVILSLIGSIPYLYININASSPSLLFQSITDSIFESTSGFTTTGFSVIPDLSALPTSLILYRGLTQFIGGIGIVVVLLAFFYPEAKLRDFARSMGLVKNHHVKKAFTLILAVYLTLIVIMIVLALLFGYHDIINLASIIFAAIGTGGFSPVNDMTQIATTPPMNYIILASMMVGAFNFIVLAGLLKKKIKEFFNSEISAFFLIAMASIALVIFYFKFSAFDATFHVISAMSTTGFSYLPVQSFPDSLKLFIVFLMFVGGTSFSTAGGVKIYRLVLLLKATKKAVVETVTEQDGHKVKLFGREYSNAEILQAAMMVLLAIAIVFVSSLIISSYGFRPIDSVFEATSAIATTGLSTGIVSFGLAVELKWLFVFLMLLGRVEIIAFLVIFCKDKETTPDQCPRRKRKATRKNGTHPEDTSEPVELPDEDSEPVEPLQDLPVVSVSR